MIHEYHAKLTTSLEFICQCLAVIPNQKKKKDSTPKEFLKEFLEDTHEVNVLISFEYTELLISSYTLQGK